jgi:surface carbohydrate biosynthesis protein
VFHDKALIPSTRRIAFRQALVDDGFLLTSQDEEHGLIEPGFDAWAHGRFSSDSLQQAHQAFAWGPRDATGLRRLFPEAHDRIVPTGSPRVDLWRPQLSGLHTPDDLGGVPPGYVLLPTNLGVGRPNQWWDQIADLRDAAYQGDDDPAEWAMYTETSSVVAYTGRLVRALRIAAKRLPDVRFVIRPHHEEGAHGWGAIIGPSPNISVIRSGSVTPWIRHARLVVHNGSTTGLEAAISNVPVLAYLPDDFCRDFASNALGRTATEPSELITAIERSADPIARRSWFDDSDRDLLSGLLDALDGPLAADRIVDAWETLPTGPQHARRVAARRSNVLAETHRRVGALRSGVGRMRSKEGFRPRFATAHKFPPLRRTDLERTVERMRSTLGRFEEVEVHQVGPRLVQLRRRTRPSITRR